MKAINSSIRGRYFFGDLDTAKYYAQSAVEKRRLRKTERARLNLSLTQELHQQASVEAKQQDIERTLKRDRMYRELLKRVSESSQTHAQFLDWAQAKGVPGFEPPADRQHVWTGAAEGRRLIASCG